MSSTVSPLGALCSGSTVSQVALDPRTEHFDHMKIWTVRVLTSAGIVYATVMPSGRSGLVPVAACNSVSVTSDTSSIPGRSHLVGDERKSDLNLNLNVTHFTPLTPIVVLVYNFLLHLHHFHLRPLGFSFLDNKPPSTLRRSCKTVKQTHLVLVLLLPAVALVTLGIGFHGHGGEEVLHGVVAQVVTDRAKL